MAHKPRDVYFALLMIRTLSISYAEGFIVFSCGKVEYDSPANAAIDARCGYFV
jgi:hypothetical protein